MGFSFRSIQFAYRLLSQYWNKSGVLDSPQMSRPGNSEPIAQTERILDADASGPGEFKKFSDNLSISPGERT
jgi:hypothetical protein